MTSEDRDDLPPTDRASGPDGSDEEASRSSHVPTSPDDGDDQPVTQKPTTRKRKALPVWLESILLLGFALLLAVVIKAFFVQAFYIPSQSMEPGLVEDDRILVQKVSYWGDGSPERGDVVVFEDPDNWLAFTPDAGPTNFLSKAMAKVGLYPTGGHLVKRVIGTPGDTVECCDDQGRLSINGKVMDESAYVQEGSRCAAPMIDCDLKPVVIPDGYLLVMGDNRDESADSTAHMCRDPEKEQCGPTRGLVPIDKVVGKVFALIWPADRFDRITRPEVFEDVPDPK